jgi:SNF family Na+-dependent transporter
VHASSTPPGIRDAYLTGRGAITMEAVAATETRSGGLPRIVVTEIPYQVNKASMLEKTAELVKAKKLDEIRDLRDESSRDGMRVVIELKRGEDPAKVLAKLYKLTDLRTNFNVNFVALVPDAKGGFPQPQTIGPARGPRPVPPAPADVLTRRTTFRRDRAAARAHVLEGLLVALDHLDEVIALIRAAESADVARTQLMERYDLSEIQATAILDMQLRRLARLEREKIAAEHRELLALIAELEAILADPAKLDALLADELKEIKKRHGNPRRSRLTGQGEAQEDAALAEAPAPVLEAQAVTVYVTAAGYLKSVPARRISAPHNHDKDPVVAVLRGTTDDTALLIDAEGGGYRIALADVPVTTMRQRGTTVAQLLGEGPDAPIAGAVLLGPEVETVVTVSANGLVKRTTRDEYEGRTRAMIAAGVKDDDAIVAVATCGDDEHLVLAHSGGLVTRFAAADVRPMGRGAAGVAGLQVPKDARVVSLSVVPADDGPEAPEILTVAVDGGAKRTALAEYPPKGRGGKGCRRVPPPSPGAAPPSRCRCRGGGAPGRARRRAARGAACRPAGPRPPGGDRTRDRRSRPGGLSRGEPSGGGFGDRTVGVGTPDRSRCPSRWRSGDAEGSMEREQWGTRTGFLLAAVGSAIGLGNIWRFPYVAYDNGGGAFMVPYLFALLTAGIPVLVLEYAIGHRHRGSAPLSFAKLHRRTEFIGWWQVLVSFVISSFYAVVVAWALAYTWFSVRQDWGGDAEAFLLGDFLRVTDAPGEIGGIVGGVALPLVLVWIVVLGVLSLGVKKGIEVANKVLIPLLVGAFLVLVVRAVTLPGAAEGLTTLFQPDWGAITDSAVWVAAYGQIFFSLSIGFAIMVTYSSYLPRRADLTNSALIAGFGNSSFELLAGIGVFAALGFMAQASGASRSTRSPQQGIVLAFIGFPEIISTLPPSTACSGCSSSARSCSRAVLADLRRPDLRRGEPGEARDGPGPRGPAQRRGRRRGDLAALRHGGRAVRPRRGRLLHQQLRDRAGRPGPGRRRRLDHPTARPPAAHANAISDVRLGRWWIVALGGITPVLLGFVIVDQVLTVAREGYEDMPWTFLLATGVSAAVLALLDRLPPVAAALAARRARVGGRRGHDETSSEGGADMTDASSPWPSPWSSSGVGWPRASATRCKAHRAQRVRDPKSGCRTS